MIRLASVALASAWLAASGVAAQPVYPVDHAEIVHAYLDTILKDPMSAIVKELRGPRVGEWEHRDVHFVCYTVNAKNSYGGYVGAHTYMFAIAYGAVQASRESPYMNDYAMRETRDRRVDAECALPADPAP